MTTARQLHRQAIGLHNVPGWGIGLGLVVLTIVAVSAQALASGQATEQLKPAVTLTKVWSVVGAQLSGSPARLTGGAVLDGIVDSQGTKFFLTSINVFQGTAAGLQLALENRSEQSTLARLELSGLPATTTVTALSLTSPEDLTVVQIDSTTFVMKLRPGLTSSTSNLELQLVPGTGLRPAHTPWR